MSGLIYKKIAEVMRMVDAIGKDNTNKMQGFKFRGIDDVYNSFHSHFKECGVFTVPEVIEERSEERTTKSGGASIYRILKIKYHFYAEDGSSVTATVIGEAMDTGDKASNKAMSVAHKYAILQVFCVPTEEDKDPDAVSHEVLPKQRPAEMYDPGNAGHKIALVKLAGTLGFKNLDQLKRISDELKDVPVDRIEYMLTHQYKPEPTAPIVAGL